tara:strand:- start:5536 stop:6384 length:849 start_codon:yes stop_codon:yes gene_type:complete
MNQIRMPFVQTHTVQKRIYSFSGGIGSWMAAKRGAAEYGPENITLLFTDTRFEDWDTYRFLEEAAHNVGANLITIADGRTPWDVYYNERFLGNSRIDPCSKILKRKMMDKWLADNCDPAETTVYVGIDWSEAHRMYGRGGKLGLKARKAADGWNYEAPMCHGCDLTKADMIQAARCEGLEVSRAYESGFKHDNCGGRCCKAGQAHWALMLKERPERFHVEEGREQDFRTWIDRDVAMMKETVKGEKRPLTLKTLRERIEAEEGYNRQDWGGCACFFGSDGEI